MNENKRNCLRKIQACDFVLYEIALFLDTHPNCREAKEMFCRYQESRREAAQDYVRCGGVLEQKSACAAERWNWIESPWPWEREEN